MIYFKTERVGLTLTSEQDGERHYRLSEHEDEISHACDMSYLSVFGYIFFPKYKNIEAI